MPDVLTLPILVGPWEKLKVIYPNLLPPSFTTIPTFKVLVHKCVAKRDLNI